MEYKYLNIATHLAWEPKDSQNLFGLQVAWWDHSTSVPCTGGSRLTRVIDNDAVMTCWRLFDSFQEKKGSQSLRGCSPLTLTGPVDCEAALIPSLFANFLCSSSSASIAFLSTPWRTRIQRIERHNYQSISHTFKSQSWARIALSE